MAQPSLHNDAFANSVREHFENFLDNFSSEAETTESSAEAPSRDYIDQVRARPPHRGTVSALALTDCRLAARSATT